MDDFKLKLVLATLGGVVFSLTFIILALVVPVKQKHVVYKKPESVLEKVSHSAKNR